MKNECKDCENESLMKYADMAIKLENVQKYNKLLEQALDIKEKLNKMLREENERIENDTRKLF